MSKDEVRVALGHRVRVKRSCTPATVLAVCVRTRNTSPQWKPCVYRCNVFATPDGWTRAVPVSAAWVYPQSKGPPDVEQTAKELLKRPGVRGYLVFNDTGAMPVVYTQPPACPCPPHTRSAACTLGLSTLSQASR